ncbi:hypothetical protein KIPB_010454 [Kipferlia bialata]|uniref:Uncharacterized protein n=1 Tax=Kipferlia bialata TaxID=797122 RepID=A0A9K3D326_9EUKA|nr:hypothetical protein KIPB_010454 [Kipferlia bialata]|eukprot:g10454.t1
MGKKDSVGMYTLQQIKDAMRVYACAKWAYTGVNLPYTLPQGMLKDIEAQMAVGYDTNMHKYRVFAQDGVTLTPCGVEGLDDLHFAHCPGMHLYEDLLVHTGITLTPDVLGDEDQIADIIHEDWKELESSLLGPHMRLPFAVVARHTRDPVLYTGAIVDRYSKSIYEPLQASAATLIGDTPPAEDKDNIPETRYMKWGEFLRGAAHRHGVLGKDTPSSDRPSVYRTLRARGASPAPAPVPASAAPGSDWVQVGAKGGKRSTGFQYHTPAARQGYKVPARSSASGNWRARK